MCAVKTGQLSALNAFPHLPARTCLQRFRAEFGETREVRDERLQEETAPVHAANIDYHTQTMALIASDCAQSLGRPRSS